MSVNVEATLLDVSLSNPHSQAQAKLADDTNLNQEKNTEEEPESSSSSSIVIQPTQDAIHREVPNEKLDDSLQGSSSKDEKLQETYRPPEGKWPRKSISIVCPNCQALAYTQIKVSTTPLTILIGIAQFFFEFSLLFIPICAPPCKQINHYCPNCHSFLGEAPVLQ
ncbi:unnamed protein product [Rotaria socialis]|uniref:LITAF domain-containing protein n=1 Tax=Rotaria socialis TaxID=392032 RepID=A0A818EYB0_9BILA|nr:unnamed protein product [Rotaria socialis]CAF3357259.1 unnamed protein product [Rotaria socialis]CAF3466627.1 unnamed protein product [Rotaria socialis]CAF3478332.1 unnamed protein product [Rotaria socialis]CAF3619448.1 unnamed protein product [Rotaria socialis]